MKIELQVERLYFDGNDSRALGTNAPYHSIITHFWVRTSDEVHRSFIGTLLVKCIGIYSTPCSSNHGGFAVDKTSHVSHFINMTSTEYIPPVSYRWPIRGALVGDRKYPHNKYAHRKIAHEKKIRNVDQSLTRTTGPQLSYESKRERSELQTETT